MDRRGVIALVVSVGLVAAPAGSAAAHGKGRGPEHGSRPFPPAIAAKLQLAITSAEQDYAVPGMALGVHQPGVGDLTLTAGAADIASRTPITSATHFRIASVTKTFTATVVLQLVQEHKLSLAEHIDHWFPQLPFAGQITIRDLLQMRSGIFDEGGPGSSLVKAATSDPTRSWTPNEIVDLAVKDGSQPPGTPLYCDTNYVILAAIASAVTHTPYPELLARKVLRPLQLRDTSFPTTSLAMPGPAATPYGVELAQGQPPVTTVATTVNPSVLGGAGAMISTLPDLERWARALGTGELLPPKLQRLRVQLLPTTNIGPFGGLPPVANDTLYPGGYGLGIMGTNNFVGHNGIVSGFTSEVWFDPATGASVVVLFNSEITVDTGVPQPVFLPISTGLFMTIAEVLQGQA